MTENAIRRCDLDLRSEYVAPKNDTEARLQAIFCDTFDVDLVGSGDDFFELGGDSLAAAQICSEVFAHFGISIQPGLLARARTIKKLALKLHKLEPKSASHLVQLQVGISRKTPIIIFPGNQGYTALDPAFFTAIGDERSVYAFQIPGLSSQSECPEEIADLAKLFAAEIIELAPAKDFHFVAFCGGALVLLHVLAELAVHNVRPKNIVTVDPMFYFSEVLFHERKMLAKQPSELTLLKRLHYFLPILRRTKSLSRLLDHDGNHAAAFHRWVNKFNPKDAVEIAKRWPQNSDRAIRSTKRYRVMLRSASPPVWNGKCHVIVSRQHLNGEMYSLHFYGLKHCFSEMLLIKLPVDKHLELFSAKISALGNVLKDLFQTQDAAAD